MNKIAVLTHSNNFARVKICNVFCAKSGIDSHRAYAQNRCKNCGVFTCRICINHDYTKCILCAKIKNIRCEKCVHTKSLCHICGKIFTCCLFSCANRERRFLVFCVDYFASFCYDCFAKNEFTNKCNLCKQRKNYD